MMKNSEKFKKTQSLSLSQQCEKLKLHLRDIKIQRNDKNWIVNGSGYEKPENAALKVLESKNWHGVNGEGGPILLTLKAAGFKWIMQNNHLSSQNDAETRYLEAAIKISQDKSAGFVEEVGRCTPEQMASNFQRIYGNQFVRDEYPGLSATFMMQFFANIKSKLADIAEVFVTEPYKYRAGWPDLTVMHGSEVIFVEIKTTDKLHESQINVLQDIIIPLKINSMILRLKPS